MKISLDIKNQYGNLITRDIVVKDDNHLTNYCKKAEREWKEKIVGIHPEKDEDSDAEKPEMEVWMGTVDCGKYSIEVVGRSEQEVWKSLQKEFDGILRRICPEVDIW